MVILNPNVSADISAGRPLRIDLGGGTRPRAGYYSIDCAREVNPDIYADLSEPLNCIPDNSVSHLFSSHVLEHVRDLVTTMEEIHRIAIPNCEIEIVVPHFSNIYGYSDPTHVRLFGLYTMSYFSPIQEQPKRKVPSYYSRARFKVLATTIEFYRRGRIDSLLAGLAERLVNRSFAMQERYERRLAAFFHARQMRFLLRPLKGVPAG